MSPLALLLEQHQARPKYTKTDGIFWTCKAGCDCDVAASTMRANVFEADHQARVLVAAGYQMSGELHFAVGECSTESAKG